MAKKKESIYKTWDEVDDQLKRLGEIEIKKKRLDGEMNLKINKIKDVYKDKCININDEAKNILKEIARFCAQNKDAFLKKRSKKMNFGTIAYRLTEKLVCSSEENTVIKALKELNLDYCLRIKEELDKDKLKELNSNILAKIGAMIVKEDKLTIEPDIAEIVAKAE